MSKKQQVANLKRRFARLIREKKVRVNDIQEIDFEHEIDSKLTYNENLELLLKRYGYAKEKKEEDYEGALKQHLDESAKFAEKEFKESVKELKGGEQEYYFANLKQYVEMVAKGYAHSLLLEGSGGIGKTYEVLKTLAECNTDYEFINSYSTPLEFYQLLHEYNGKTIVLDDFEGVLDTRVGVSILKSALWSATDKRFISYYTTSEKLQVPKSFEFTGRIIFCMNSMQDNPELRALITRTLHYTLDFPIEDIKKIIMAIAKGDTCKTELTREERIKVANFILEHSDEATKELNLRTLIKAFWAYDYAIKEGADWQEIVAKMLEADEEKRLILELSKEHIRVEDMGKEFTRKTGRSRRTFFRLRKEMRLTR